MQVSRRDFLRKNGTQASLQLLSGLASMGLVPFLSPRDKGADPEEIALNMGKRHQKAALSAMLQNSSTPGATQSPGHT